MASVYGGICCGFNPSFSRSSREPQVDIVWMRTVSPLCTVSTGFAALSYQPHSTVCGVASSVCSAAGAELIPHMSRLAAHKRRCMALLLRQVTNRVRARGNDSSTMLADERSRERKCALGGRPSRDLPSLRVAHPASASCTVGHAARVPFDSSDVARPLEPLGVAGRSRIQHRSGGDERIPGSGLARELTSAPGGIPRPHGCGGTPRQPGLRPWRLRTAGTRYFRG